MVKNEAGALQIPAAIATLLLSIASFGAWGVLRQWKGQVRLQLELDECVGQTARATEHDQNAVEASNRRIQALRASIAAALLQPELLPPLKLALQAEVGAQELRLSSLRLRSARWSARLGCGSGSVPIPLPNDGWLRPPPDALGAQALVWRPGVSRGGRIELRRAGRVAAARVFQEGGTDVSRTWRSEWAARSDFP